MQNVYEMGSRVIGLVKDIGDSQAAAWREVGRLGLDTNRSVGSKPTTAARHIHRVNATQTANQGKFLKAINVANRAT